MSRSVRHTRRRFLQGGAALLGAALAAPSGPSTVRAATIRPIPRRQTFQAIPGQDLTEPPVRQSAAGLLATSLTAQTGSTSVGGRSVQTSTYDGLFPGPTLRFRPGDQVSLALNNRLASLPSPSPARSAVRTPVHDHRGAGMVANATNLHLHGLHVSPQGVSDNIFLEIAPGAGNTYAYQIPGNQSGGLFWYHPHYHGLTQTQVSSGMAGAMIIDGPLDSLPGIAGLRERLLLLQTIQVDAVGVDVPANLWTPAENLDPTTVVRLVNGQFRPVIRIQPGETQRWRIGNITADNWFNLQLEGHQLNAVAADGNPMARLSPRDSVLLGPGERLEVLVQAGAAGSYQLKQLAFPQGFLDEPATTLATMVVGGAAVTPQPLPSALIPFVDLRTVPIAAQRTFVLSYTSFNPFTAAINGLPFDENRVDTQVQLETVEEWRIVNQRTGEWHPFHLHVNPFQVVAVNGQPYAADSYKDTFPVSIVNPNVPGDPIAAGEITFRVRFSDFVGKFVYDCHILGHEDPGMMAVIEVLPRVAPTPVVPEPSTALLFGTGALALARSPPPAAAGAEPEGDAAASPDG